MLSGSRASGACLGDLRLHLVTDFSLNANGGYRLGPSTPPQVAPAIRSLLSAVGLSC